MNFQANEKVLCYHGPLIYQAKILKAEIWTGQDPSEGGFTGPHYFVHYQGWKATWDEWVPESRVLKMNDENAARQKALLAAAKNKGKEGGGTTGAASSSSSSSTAAAASGSNSSRQRESARSRSSMGGGGGGAGGSGGAGGGSGASGDKNVLAGSKRSREQAANSEEEEYLRKPEIKIVIPDALKVQLVDDWENVTKKDLLVPLPRKPCVKDILKLYKDSVVEKRKSTGAASAKLSTNTPLAVVDEVLGGLQLYFDKALGNNLLYRFERTQYLNARKSGGVSDESTTSAATATAASDSAAGDSTAAAADAAATAAAATSTPPAKPKRERGGLSSSDMPKDDVAPSEIYGAEHLLRLFVNLPAIIAHTTMDASSVSVLREQLDDFLHFLVKEKEKGRLFAKYEPASPAYHRISAV